MIWLWHYTTFSNKERKRIDKLNFEDIFLLVISFFKQSKNNPVLDPRTGRFREHVGFNAMAKNVLKNSTSVKST